MFSALTFNIAIWHEKYENMKTAKWEITEWKQ